MRVLVTGSDGYLGCLLTPQLMAEGHEVVGLDTGYYKTGWLCPDHVVGVTGRGHEATPHTLVRDIREVTVDDLRGFDAIVHMAQQLHNRFGIQHATIQIELADTDEACALTPEHVV